MRQKEGEGSPQASMAQQRCANGFVGYGKQSSTSMWRGIRAVPVGDDGNETGTAALGLAGRP